jgi:hypothetical protein
MALLPVAADVDAASPADCAALESAVAASDPDGAQRVLCVAVDGQRYWVKRAEQLSRRWRLQKGDPARAFARERAAMAALAGRGLPVAAPVAEGPGYIALPDFGPPLTALPGPAGSPERLTAFAAGGAALAALHAAGIAHGRPNIRDICWSGQQATLIDLERCDPAQGGRRAMRDDLFLLLHSAVAALGADAPEIGALIAGYRAAAPAGPWRDAARRARRLAWFAPLWRLATRLDTRRGDFAAVLPALEMLTAPPMHQKVTPTVTRSALAQP